MGNAVTTSADILWWIFVATILAVVVLVGGLGIAMVVAQRRLVAVHRAYTQRLLAAHEEERARVAREVHDDAIQRLVVVRHELDELGASVGPAFDAARRRHLDGIRNEVQDLADALRRLAHRLHPATIEQAGISVALAQLAEEVERSTGVRVQLDLPEAPALPADASIALFRIAQESLRNVARHSGSKAATLSLRANTTAAELVISDDGIGFDPAATARIGLGLVGIEERARLVGGTALIESAPEKGTTVVVRVPCQRDTER